MTAAEKAGWTAGTEQAAQAAVDIADLLNQIADIDGRMDHVEESLFSNITANPYTVAFDSLDGIILTAGAWNATSRRLEC